MNPDAYVYQPSDEDIEKFEALWDVLWRYMFHPDDYSYGKNLLFEVWLCGMNQHKYDLRASLDKLLGENDETML